MPQTAIPTKEQVRQELARRRLLDFTLYTYPSYQVNWHHRVMCEFLDVFVRGQNQRLMIFAPPRHGKSEVVSRRLPAFVLGRDPDATIIAASYGADLASRMNRDVQRIIDSQEYARLFPQTRLFGQNIRSVAMGSWLRNSDMFEVVNHKGYYISSGVGGSITGSGASTIIVDDPVKNRKEANSPTFRDGVWEWYTSTLYTRLAPGGNILLTVTRWHQDDLAGRLLAAMKSDPGADQWQVVELRGIAEEPVPPYDPRQPGQSLWRTRWDEAEMEKKRITVGSYDWASLYQQRPAPREGGMFKRAWFETVLAAPAKMTRVRYWDKATATGAGADYTAGVLMGVDEHHQYFVEDVVRGQYSPLERETIIRETAKADKLKYGNVAQWFEQEPGSGGKESALATVKLLRGFNVRVETSSGDKEVRALPLSAQCEARNVRLVQAPWNGPYLDELTAFPNGSHDDMVDCSAGAFNKLANVIQALLDYA